MKPVARKKLVAKGSGGALGRARDLLLAHGMKARARTLEQLRGLVHKQQKRKRLLARKERS